eukprot:552501-Prymnesium_polylepis.1
MEEPIRLIAAKARALGMLDNLTVSFIAADSVATHSICEGAPGFARDNGISVPDDTVYTVDITPGVQEVKSVLAPMQEAAVDVIVACTYDVTVDAIVKALQELEFSPKALVANFGRRSTYDKSWECEAPRRPGLAHPRFSCADPVCVVHLADDYLLVPIPWHPLYNSGVGAFSNMTSLQFADAYSAEYGGDVPSYLAASMFASLCALAVAIEQAGTLETSAVAAQLRALQLI